MKKEKVYLLWVNSLKDESYRYVDGVFRNKEKAINKGIKRIKKWAKYQHEEEVEVFYSSENIKELEKIFREDLEIEGVVEVEEQKLK